MAGRAASSVPLKVRVTILPTAVAWQFSSLMTNDSVGERPGGYQKSLDARVLKTTCLFRLSPDTWQGLSSRLPLNATSEAIACPADSAANSKERLCFLSSHSLTHILCSDAAWPDCSWHQNTHPPVSPFSSRRPASPPAAGQAGTVKVSPSCITRWSQPDSLRSGSKALPVPGPVTSEPETVIATPRFPG